MQHTLLTPLCFLAAAALTPAVAFQNPTCDPGGAATPSGIPLYNAECNGVASTVQLDATGSVGVGPLAFFWQENCPNASFDDPSSPMPVLTLDMSGSCMEECGGITLTVTDRSGSSSCMVAVLVTDTLPPVITCPPDVTVGSGAPTDPGSTGTATAVDQCAGVVATTFVDVVNGNVITRTWSAADGCGTASCVQTITVEDPQMEDPGLDIKPTSCPNPINVKSKGVVPVALTGGPGFDVNQVDRLSLVLVRNDGVGGAVVPIVGRMRVQDTATPFDGELCDCHGYGADGFNDLNMKFVKQQVVTTFLLAGEANKAEIQLDLHGVLLDGTAFVVSDCIRVQNK